MENPCSEWKCEVDEENAGNLKVYYHINPPAELGLPKPPKKWRRDLEIYCSFGKEYFLQFVVTTRLYKYKTVLTFEPRTETSGLVKINDTVRALKEKKTFNKYLMRYEEMDIGEFVIRYFNRRNMTVTEPQGWWDISDGVETEFSSLCVDDDSEYDSEPLSD